MKISHAKVKVLKNTLKSIFGNAKLYLFGSRVDDDKRGGDIDLLVVADDISKKDIRNIRLDFFKHFGEQKRDIVLDDGKFRDPFSTIIFEKAILI